MLPIEEIGARDQIVVIMDVRFVSVCFHTEDYEHTGEITVLWLGVSVAQHLVKRESNYIPQ